jgi:antitoxin VapB
MSLNIKNPETVRLARELAARTGESLTRALTLAVEERLERVREAGGPGREQRLDRIRKVSQDAAARWVEPYSSADHGDLLYDARGLPR